MFFFRGSTSSDLFQWCWFVEYEEAVLTLIESQPCCRRWGRGNFPHVTGLETLFLGTFVRLPNAIQNLRRNWTEIAMTGSSCFAVIGGKLQASLVEDIFCYWRTYTGNESCYICSVSDLLFWCRIYPVGFGYILVVGSRLVYSTDNSLPSSWGVLNRFGR